MSTNKSPFVQTKQFYSTRFSPYSLPPSHWTQTQPPPPIPPPLPFNRFSPQFYSRLGEFTASNTSSPNISTTSSGYSTSAEDSGIHDEKLTIKKENEISIENKSPKVPTDLSIENLIKPSSSAVAATGINWNNMVLPTDNIYEMATRILFASVKWARTQRSFLSLPFSDQAVLLEDGWSDLFILTAAETKFITNESMLSTLPLNTKIKSFKFKACF